ncbi:MAG TPA: carboxypeptidase-like regulatory domain-containing protein, partial [Candidatus Sulfopaludibacter sp.]|nr:carboxypeptidase-like regulatory domain-containing protein [Candidatus Sulfopaludibacter sp.]
MHSDAPSLDRAVSSDSSGEFRFSDLPPGRYRLSVAAQGFATADAEVAVAVHSEREINVTLHPAASQQAVNVPGAVSSITAQTMDTTGAVQGGTISARDLASTPLAHRSFANIAYLVPGTEPVEPSDPTKARITAVSFGGSSGLNDVTSVDGADNSD